MSHRDKEIELLKAYQEEYLIYDNIEEGMLIRPATLLDFFKNIDDLETYASRQGGNDILDENAWKKLNRNKGFVVLVPLLVLEVKETYCKILKKESVVYVPRTSIDRVRFAILKQKDEVNNVNND
jgi:hypothetical protein